MERRGDWGRRRGGWNQLFHSNILSCRLLSHEREGKDSYHKISGIELLLCPETKSKNVCFWTSPCTQFAIMSNVCTSLWGRGTNVGTSPCYLASSYTIMHPAPAKWLKLSSCELSDTPSFGWDIKPRSWLTVVIKDPVTVFAKSRGCPGLIRIQPGTHPLI